MSNYSKLTNFTTKDSLPSGNPNKIIKGTEIDVELTAIQSAVATKADAINGTISNTTLSTSTVINGDLLVNAPTVFSSDLTGQAGNFQSIAAINGVFSGTVIAATPVTANDVTTKGYVDSVLTSVGDANSRTYQSYAAAIADMSNIAEGQTVVVLVDETKNNGLAYYTKTSGALVFVSVRDFYTSPLSYVQSDTVQNMITKLLVLVKVIPEINPVINANFTDTTY